MMRAVLRGRPQEFIQGSITPSGLATQVRRGIIKGFDSSSYRATVQLLGSLSVWLDGVPVAKHIGANLLVSGARCGVLFFDESNPSDACLAFVYDGAPDPWITSGLVVDGTITATDCLSNTAGGVATLDAAGDLNPPNHVRAAGRFYPGGQGSRYLYDAGATSGLAVAGGPFSTTDRIYPGTGSTLQSTAYLAADGSGNLALMGGRVGIGTTAPGARLEVNGDIAFSSGAARSVGVATPSTNVAGDSLAVHAGAAYPSGPNSQDGGSLYSYAGDGYGLDGSGGKVYIFGGAKGGANGRDGDVVLCHTGSAGRGFVGIGTVNPNPEGQADSYGILAIAGKAARYMGLLYLQCQSPLAGDSPGHIIGMSGSTRVCRIELGTSGAVNTGIINFHLVTSGAEALRYKFQPDGTALADVAWNTFSPIPPKVDMTPDEYLDWALEHARKPAKPYGGIPQDPVGVERYVKDPARIAIGTARYVEHLRNRVATLEARLAQLEVA
jgi:hypothetical protein